MLSLGRVLLAAAGHYLSAPLVDSVSAAMIRLAEVRQHGWSLTSNETLPGISSLSVSIHNKHHYETVALCLSFLSQDTEPGYPANLLEALRATAAAEMAEKYGA